MERVFRFRISITQRFPRCWTDSNLVYIAGTPVGRLHTAAARTRRAPTISGAVNYFRRGFSNPAVANHFQPPQQNRTEHPTTDRQPPLPYAPLWQPLHLKHLTIRNRVLSTSHAPNYVQDGFPQERYQKYHETKARGGIGMTMIGGSSCVSKDSPPSFGQIDMTTDDVVPHLQKLSERVHA